MGEFDNAIEAGNGGASWKPEKGDSIFGTYSAKKENVGVNGSTVYVIQEDGKDEPTSVWSSTVLDTKFEEIPIMSRVKIEYLGKQQSNKGRGEYKDYRVYYVPSKLHDVFPGAKEV